MRSAIAFISLAALGLLAWMAVTRVAPTFERELLGRARGALAPRGTGLVVQVDGRDVTVTGQIAAGATRAQLIAALAELPGVGEVDVRGVSEAPAGVPRSSDQGSPSSVTVGPGGTRPSGAVGPGGTRPNDAAAAPESPVQGPERAASEPEAVLDMAALDASEATGLPASGAVPAGPAVRRAPHPVRPAAPSVPPSVPPSPLGPGSPLDPRACREAVRSLTLDPRHRIGFQGPDSAELSVEGLEALRQFAEMLARCPEVKGVVEGYHHDLGDPDRIRSLTLRRAEAALSALGRLGIATGRFTVNGRGYLGPRYPNNAKERHLNERVEIKLGGS